MENKQRHNGHTISRLTAHIVWVTKYRYKVLEGDIKTRCRTLVKQICEAEDVVILSGVVSSDHVHLHIEYPPNRNISDIVKRIKGRTSRRIQEEFPHISNDIGEDTSGLSVMEYGVPEISQTKWSSDTSNITERQTTMIRT